MIPGARRALRQAGPVRDRGIPGGFLETARKVWLGPSLPYLREIALLGIPFLIIAVLMLRVVRSTRASDAAGQAPARTI